MAYEDPTTINTTWTTLHLADEPSSIIRVSNLSTNISGPADAWGRFGRPQPVSVSVEIFLAKPFSDSSTGDVLQTDTVHYGLLSKALMKVLEKEGGKDLMTVVAALRHELVGEKGETAGGFLEGKGVRYLKIGVHLPKATRLGDGISLVSSVAFGNSAERKVLSTALTLKFHDLKIPVLIGVNENERAAKQMVIANVEIDRYAPAEAAHFKIENSITGAMESSSFETLEALASKICKDLNGFLQTGIDASLSERGFRYKVRLEKPIAVALAEAPCVEFNVDQCDLEPRC